MYDAGGGSDTSDCHSGLFGKLTVLLEVLMGVEIRLKAKHIPKGQLSRVVIKTIESMVPTNGDLVAAALLVRTITLERTARGQDLHGKPFATYSTKGPIYIDVGKKSGPRTKKQKIASAQRFSKKVGLSTKVFKKTFSKSQRSATRRTPRFAERRPARSRLIRGVTAFGQITPGGYLKVRSYAEFKFRILGRAFVDLFGHRAPHMLHSLVVRFSGGSEISSRKTIAIDEMKTRPRPVALGWFGADAKIAIAHNFGRGDLPKREFFGMTPKLANLVSELILRRTTARAKRAGAQVS